MASATRPFQVAVWGASGFVGRLVCERLAKEYPNQLRLAIAGRSRAKLESVRDEMAQYDPSFRDVGILIAEADDREAIDTLTQSTDVIISVAGPYRKYSSEVVASSAENGTHYLDLTAELPWVRDNIRRYHDIALKNKAKIVHFCGYECVPMDLCTLFIVDEIRKTYGTYTQWSSLRSQWCSRGCQSVQCFLVSSYGGVSGGTMASLQDIYATASPAESTALQDPNCLLPQYLKSTHLSAGPSHPTSGSSAPSGDEFTGFGFNKDLKSWLVPFVFSKTDTQVITRSSALAKQPYGKDFSYREGLKVPNLPLALLAQFFSVLLDVALEYSFLRALTQLAAPQPGTGPDLNTQRKSGFWKLLFVGYPEGQPSAKPVIVKMEDNAGDPGYWSTSKLLVECALSLILDQDKVAEAESLAGGILTPAVAFGVVPLKRLQQSGLIVERVA